MSTPKSAIIIGGGLVGLLTAAELVQRGFRVTVLEAGEFAKQASWAGGGILSPLAPWDEPDEITELVALSVALTRQWMTEFAVDYGPDCEYWACGMRVHDENGAARHWLARHSVAHRFDGDSVSLPEVAQLRTPRYGKRMLAWLDAHDAQLLSRTEAASVEAQSVMCLDGSQLRADLVCVCAGPWSARIPGVGVATNAVAPVRGQMLLLDASGAAPENIERRGSTYLIPRRDGRVLIGSTLEQTGFDVCTTHQARSALWQSAVALRPSLQDHQIERQWAGLRPASATGMPIIGFQVDSGVWINTGHFRNGVTLAAGSARLLADEILGHGRPAWADSLQPASV